MVARVAQGSDEFFGSVGGEVGRGQGLLARSGQQITDLAGLADRRLGSSRA